MSSNRNTNYAPGREAEKPSNGFGKSMHGDSLKPGDTVYGPAVVEDSRGNVQVLSKHWGIVVASDAESVTVMYSTSEKSYNVAHSQSFSAEDKGLSSGMAKDGHWSRSDYYKVPSELLERRGYVSDATWDKVQRAASNSARNGSDVVLPELVRDGSLKNTNGRPSGHWNGMSAAMSQVAAERAVSVPANAGRSAEEMAVRDAKAEAVGVIQELLKQGAGEPAHRYSANDAAQLADRINDAPKGAIVALNPQDKLRVVENAKDAQKLNGWTQMSASDAKELIESEVSRVRAQHGAKPKEAPAVAEANAGTSAPHGDKVRRGPGAATTLEVGSAALVMSGLVANRLADGRGVNTDTASLFRALEKSPVTYPLDKANEALDKAGDLWRKNTGLPTVGDLQQKALDRVLDTEAGRALTEKVKDFQNWLQEKNPQTPRDAGQPGMVMAAPDASVAQAGTVPGSAQASLAAQVQSAADSSLVALLPDGGFRFAETVEGLGRLPDGAVVAGLGQVREALEGLGREGPQALGTARDTERHGGAPAFEQEAVQLAKAPQEQSREERDSGREMA